MPGRGGLPAGTDSNLDPISVFNGPTFTPDVNVTRGAQKSGTAPGLFDGFIPSQQMSQAPAATMPAYQNPITNYAAPVNTRGTINPSYVPGMNAIDVAQRNAQALLAGGRAGQTAMPSQLPTYQPPSPQLLPSMGIPIGNTTPSFNYQPSTFSGADSASAQWLASLMSGNQYLQNFAQNGQAVQLTNPNLQQMAQNGMPVNALPAWQSYVDAMQRNTQSGAANLMEMFNQSGGYQSTSFGNAAVDYMDQITKDQNSLLAQMGYQSLSDAAGRQLQAGSLLDQLQFQGLNDAVNRQYGAAQQLSQQAYGAGQTLTGYDFQSQMAQYQASLQAAMMAAQSAGGLQANAASQLGQYGSQAANQLLANALGGTSNLFQGSQSALSQMFGASNQVPAQLLQAYLGQQGQNMSGYQSLMNAYLSNLGLGQQLGGSQYNTLQSQLGSLYQEWMRTQPGYNPLLPYMFQGATGYVPTTNTTTPSGWDYFSQILGSVIGAAGTALGGIFSDERMKENIVPVGHIKDVPFYEYEYVGFPGKRIGVMAQEIAAKHPTAVSLTPEGTYVVHYDQLAQELLLQGGLN